jgi:hypothetical protein
MIRGTRAELRSVVDVAMHDLGFWLWLLALGSDSSGPKRRRCQSPDRRGDRTGRGADCGDASLESERDLVEHQSGADSAQALVLRGQTGAAAPPRPGQAAMAAALRDCASRRRRSDPTEAPVDSWHIPQRGGRLRSGSPPEGEVGPRRPAATARTASEARLPGQAVRSRAAVRRFARPCRDPPRTAYPRHRPDPGPLRRGGGPARADLGGPRRHDRCEGGPRRA